MSSGWEFLTRMYLHVMSSSVSFAISVDNPAAASIDIVTEVMLRMWSSSYDTDI